MRNLIWLFTIFFMFVFTSCSSNKFKNNIYNINQKDFISQTALHDAVRSGDRVMVEGLIKEKIDLDIQDKYGSTALHLAARYNQLDIVKTLVHNKAEVNTEDSFGDTPLLDSTRNGYSEISKLLICNGAKKDVVDKYNMTPLHYVSKNEQFDTFRLLKSEDLVNDCKEKDEEILEPVVENIQEISVEEIPQVLDNNETNEPSNEDISNSLVDDLGNFLESWNVTLNKENLSIIFNDTELMFENGSYEINVKYKLLLDDFFPKYLKVIKKYEDQINKIYIEGHTSSKYGNIEDEEIKFEKNQILSTNRANEVLNYIKSIEDLNVIENMDFISNKFEAIGKSSSNPILNEEGTENFELSRRVEFKIDMFSNKLGK